MARLGSPAMKAHIGLVPCRDGERRMKPNRVNGREAGRDVGDRREILDGIVHIFPKHLSIKSSQSTGS